MKTSLTMWLKTVKNQRKYTIGLVTAPEKTKISTSTPPGRHYGHFRWWTAGHYRGVNMGDVAH